jgi:hypothetical protein
MASSGPEGSALPKTSSSRSDDEVFGLLVGCADCVLEHAR